MENAVTNVNSYENLYTIIKENLWFVALVCVCVVIIVYTAFGLIMGIAKFISKKFEDSEYIEIGKFKIKNRQYVNKNTIANRNYGIMNMDANSFISLLDILISNQTNQVVSKTIELINMIHTIESNYDNQVNDIFSTTFSTLINEYYEKLIAYACEVTPFDNTNIRKSREYFFIADMIQSIRELWTTKSKDIIERNGFDLIIEDRSRANKYIEELNQCTQQALNVQTIELTAFKKSEVEEIITEIEKTNRLVFEDMFYKLGELKKGMMDKRIKKLSMVDEYVKKTVETLMNDLTTKLMLLPPEKHEEQEKN